MQIAELVIDLVLNGQAGLNGLNRAEKALDRVRDRALQAADTFQRLGAGLTIFATTPIVGALGSVVNVAGDFEAAMIRAADATKATADEAAALSQAAIAPETFNATDAARAIEVLGKNGIIAQDVLNGALDATLNLAGALRADLGSAADVATDAMLQFGKGAEELPRVADLLVGAAFESKLAFDDLRLAFGQGGGSAGGFGLDLEDFITGLTKTASFFTSGSDAGTGFKTFLARLTPQSKEAREEIEKLGLEFFNADGSMKSLAAISDELQKGLSKLTQEQRNLSTTVIFGADAQRLAIGLAQDGAAGFEELGKKINQVSAEQKALLKTQGFRGELRKLRDAISDLSIAIGNSGILDFATILVEKLTGLVRRFGELEPQLLRFGTILAGLVATLGPILLLFGRMILVMLSFRRVLGIGALLTGIALALEDIGFYMSGLPSVVGDLVSAFESLGLSAGKAEIALAAIAILLLKFGPRILAALTFTPIGRAIALIIGGAVLLYENWDRIIASLQTLWSDFVSSVETEARRIGEAIDAYAIEPINRLLDKVNSLTGLNLGIDELVEGSGSTTPPAQVNPAQQLGMDIRDFFFGESSPTQLEKNQTAVDNFLARAEAGFNPDRDLLSDYRAQTNSTSNVSTTNQTVNIRVDGASNPNDTARAIRSEFERYQSGVNQLATGVL